MQFSNYTIYLRWLALFLVTTGVPAQAHTNLPLTKDSNPIVLKSLDQNGISSTSAPKSLLNQGRTLFEAGRIASAVKLWEAASVGFERQGDAINQAWSLSYVSLASQNLGDWQKAELSITKSLNILQPILLS